MPIGVYFNFAGATLDQYDEACRRLNNGQPMRALSEWPDGGCLEHAAWRLDRYNLSVVTTRRPAVDTYELLASPRFGELIHSARQRQDFIVLDSPPILPAPDCRLLAEFIDGFLVVVNAGRTPRKLVEEALILLGPAAGVETIKTLELIIEHGQWRKELLEQAREALKKFSR